MRLFLTAKRRAIAILMKVIGNSFFHKIDSLSLREAWCVNNNMFSSDMVSVNGKYVQDRF